MESFLPFERVVCSWSFVTTAEEEKKTIPFLFALKVAKRKQTSLLFFLTWSKQNLQRKVYTWLPLYFLLVFHFSIFLWQKVFKQVFFVFLRESFKWYSVDESRDKFKEVRKYHFLNQTQVSRQTLKNKYN